MLLQCLGRKPPLQLHSLAAWSALYTRGFATNHIGTSSASPSKLDEIMKVDALIDKTPEEVQDIWTNVCAHPPHAHLHVSQNCPGAVTT